MKQIIAFLKDEEGATAIEYAILVALIAAAIVTAVTTSGNHIAGIYGAISDWLGTITLPTI